jgi:hypothetical protein
MPDATLIAMRALNSLRDALGSFGRSKRQDFYGRAEEGRRALPAELAVLEAALSGGGPSAAQLVRQLQETPHVWRLRSDDGSFEMRISTLDPLWIRQVPRAGWYSDWIPVADSASGRRLELKVSVLEPGIVGLLGRTADNRRWPREWSVSAAVLDQVRADGPWLRLPTSSELKAAHDRAAQVIAAWLDVPDILRGQRGFLRADPPASDEAIADFEADRAFTSPEAYRSLLRVADGIEIDTISILGTCDAYRLDLPGPPRLVISPPTEDGALVLDEDGEVIWMDIDDPDATGSVRAPDLRTWLVDRLRPGGPA